eukprot:405071-Prorocentrum_minimum.AAC.1
MSRGHAVNTTRRPLEKARRGDGGAPASLLKGRSVVCGDARSNLMLEALQTCACDDSITPGACARSAAPPPTRSTAPKRPPPLKLNFGHLGRE